MLKIGSVLKQTRLEKRMTLEDLSSKCGYSKALISRIENNSVSPSIASLTKISETLDLKLYDIFANVDVDEPAILRNEERQKFSVRDGKYEIEFLTTSQPSRMMQPLLVSLKSGSDSGKGTDLHNGEEFLLVLKGRAEILVGENRYILRQGDSIYFKSGIPHRYKNIGKGKAVSLAVTYPPYY